MSRTFRYTVTVDDVKKRFLKIRETSQGDLVIVRRGRHHEINLIDYSITNRKVTHESVAVHHSPNSEIGSITNNRHRRVDGTDQPFQVAYLLDVGDSPRLAPIYASSGKFR
jgi:hypothetical protein